MKESEISEPKQDKTKNIFKKILIVVSLAAAYLTGNYDVINQLINLL